jgi:hypothetical protein
MRTKQRLSFVTGAPGVFTVIGRIRDGGEEQETGD